MRTILRLDIWPRPEEDQEEAEERLREERLRQVAVSHMLQRLTKWLETEYPEWQPFLQIIVGYEDSEKEAGALLKQRWVVANDPLERTR